METIPDRAAWQLLARMARNAVGGRQRLTTVTHIDHIASAIEKAANILVVTGAGIAVSCGIPDFRSRGGIYREIEERFSLPDPTDLFDIEYFRSDPQPFFLFAKVSLCATRGTKPNDGTKTKPIFLSGIVSRTVQAGRLASLYPPARVEGQIAEELHAEYRYT